MAYLVATASLSLAPFAEMRMGGPLYHHPAHHLAEMSERDRIIDLYPASPAALEFVQRSREEEEEEEEMDFAAGMLTRDDAPRVPSPIFANFVMDRGSIDYDGVDGFDAQMAQEAEWMADAHEAAWIAEMERGGFDGPYPPFAPQHMGWQPPPGDTWMPMDSYCGYGGGGFYGDVVPEF